MKTVPVSMQAGLDSGVTTHCLCWKLTRNDGIVLGFTDHDESLTFDDVVFLANTGVTGTAIDSSLGLNVDNMEFAGVLDSATLDEAELAAGIYDDAEVVVYRVDWQNVADRVILLAGYVGQVNRGAMAFTAEVRGLAAKLNQKTGRMYEPACDVADFGDTRCGLDLDGVSPQGHPFKVSSAPTTVISDNELIFDTAEVQALPEGWFSGGKLIWSSGANEGAVIEIRVHQRSSMHDFIVLFEPMAYPIEVGDLCTLVAGCDRSLKRCKFFSNVKNFRGFPHIPGPDSILRTARKGENNDGGSIFD